MNTRVRQLEGSTKWVAESKVDCCNWVYIDPFTLEAHMPVLPYEDWFEHQRQVDAIDTAMRFEERKT
jgi:hypothetical protein